MKLTLSPSGTFDILSNVVTLRNAQPVINGARVELWQARRRTRDAGPEESMIEYTAPVLSGAVFVIVATGKDHGAFELRYWIESLPEDLVLDSFGIEFSALENLRAYYRSGYHSWDGSYYVEPESVDWSSDRSDLETGYGVTQLLPRHEPGNGSLVMGFVRHDRFQHTFTFDARHCPPSLTVLTLWDRKDRRGLRRCESERLVVFEHPGVEEGLREWARIVAEAAPRPPRLPAQPLTGWTSWYDLYAHIDEAVLLERLHAAAEFVQREKIPLRVFQIDAGFSAQTGDWLEVKPEFPRGIKPLLDQIRAEGFVPGLWIAPFMVGNRSHLAAQHPDWLLKDRRTIQPLVQWRRYGEFRWHERSEEYYILDATHPEALEYLRRVFHTWRCDWGCEFFKIDFLHYGSEYGPDRAIYHTPGRTRIEIWTDVAEMIREEIGDATWLACGSPLWPAVGLVEGIRIGNDVGISWTGRLSAQSLLRDLAARNFANHVVWESDPDVVLLRDQHHYLTDGQVRSLAIYAGMVGGVIMTSDDLSLLSPGRVRLLKLIANAPQGGCRFPFLGQAWPLPGRYVAKAQANHKARGRNHHGPAVVQVRGPSPANGVSAVFVFNLGECPIERTMPLAALGLAGAQYVYDWIADRAWQEPVDRLSVTLPPHDGVLLFLSPTPITSAPLTLPSTDPTLA